MREQGGKLKFHLSTSRQAVMRDWCLTYLHLWYKYGNFRQKNQQQASCGSGKKSFVGCSQRGSRSSKRENQRTPPPKNFQLKQKNNLLYKHGQFQAAYSFRPIYKMTL